MDAKMQEWERTKALFECALDLPSAARTTFLAQNCPNEAIRRQVEQLLHDHEAAGSFLAEPSLGAQVLPSDLWERPEGANLRSELAEEWGFSAGSLSDSLIGSRVGAYQVERCIGTGGMAAVYLASRADTAYDKQVAIKIVRCAVEGSEILERFRNERQTLASLDHPNIVRLIDGGSTEQGFPFLVMDYVEGTPIDRYCDNHTLPIEERLQLFCHVCTAVQHAHNHSV